MQVFLKQRSEKNFRCLTYVCPKNPASERKAATERMDRAKHTHTARVKGATRVRYRSTRPLEKETVILFVKSCHVAVNLHTWEQVPEAQLWPRYVGGDLQPQPQLLHHLRRLGHAQVARAPQELNLR